MIAAAPFLDRLWTPTIIRKAPVVQVEGKVRSLQEVAPSWDLEVMWVEVSAFLPASVVFVHWSQQQVGWGRYWVIVYSANDQLSFIRSMRETHNANIFDLTGGENKMVGYQVSNFDSE